MTKLLEKAFAKAAQLPKDEQDLLAQMLLDDFVAEEKWNKIFAASQDGLAILADEALAEHKARKTRKLEEML